jgi:hypothetical protein
MGIIAKKRWLPQRPIVERMCLPAPLHIEVLGFRDGSGSVVP